MMEGLTFTQLQERNAVLVTDNESLSRRVQELEAQLAALAKQEPVAYRKFVKDEHDSLFDCYEYFDFQGVSNKREPLFIRAAPPAPFVVDSKSFERGLFTLNETLDDCGDSEHGLLLALTKMGLEVQGE